MKLNFQLDNLDDFDEEGQPTFDLKQAVVAEVVRQLLSGVKDDLLESAIDEVREQLRKTVREEVHAKVRDVINAPVQKTNSYGEPKGEPKTLVEHVSEEAKHFLYEKVSESGKSPSYNDKTITRAQFFARQMAEETIKTELRPVIDAAKKTAIEYVTSEFSSAIQKAIRDKFDRG